MKFYFDGWAFTPDLTYKFQWQDAQSGGSPTLEWGYAQYVLFHGVGGLGGDVGIKGGQTKNYAFKEQAIVADTQQLMVERSFLDSAIGGNAGLFGGPLIEGVDVVYTGKKTPLHLDVMFNGGDGSGLSNYTDTTPAGLKNNFGAAARADYKVFGDWSDNSDFSGKSAKHDFLDLGAGVDFSEGQTTAPVGRASSQAVRLSADVQYTAANHFTFYGDYLVDYIGANSTSTTTAHHRTDMGGLLQGGYFILPAVEIVARYDFVDYDGGFKVGGRDLYQEAGAGVAWYLGRDGAWGSHAKVNVDVNYLPNGTPAVTGLDYAASPSGHDAVVIRSQFQLWL
jgi:hypothetical protein